MAQQLTCDQCNSEPAILIQTNIGEGDIIAVGAGCAPVFFATVAMTLLECGDHQGPAGKCQACRRLHEKMTTPAAPLTVPDDDQNDHTAEPGGTQQLETAE